MHRFSLQIRRAGNTGFDADDKAVAARIPRGCRESAAPATRLYTRQRGPCWHAMGRRQTTVTSSHVSYRRIRHASARTASHSVATCNMATPARSGCVSALLSAPCPRLSRCHACSTLRHLRTTQNRCLTNLSTRLTMKIPRPSSAPARARLRAAAAHRRAACPTAG